MFVLVGFDAGHARLLAYDLTTGAEKWSVSGIPAGNCASPVVAEGSLFFAGYSPGGPDDVCPLCMIDVELGLGEWTAAPGLWKALLP